MVLILEQQRHLSDLRSPSHSSKNRMTAGEETESTGYVKEHRSVKVDFDIRSDAHKGKYWVLICQTTMWV